MKIETKKPKFTNKKETQVDVELNHPEFGWIPYTFHYETKDESFDGLVREYLNKKDTLIEAFKE